MQQKPIDLFGCLNAHVYSNDFVMRVNSIYKKTAIKLEDCKEFIVENNNILFTNTNCTTATGIHIINSGSKTNLIYNNNIENTTYGIVGDGKNRGTAPNYIAPNKGLKFLCNDFSSFTDASYYFSVTNCNNASGQYGVSQWQMGAIDGDYDSPNYNSTPDRTNLTQGTDINDFANPTSSVGAFDLQYKKPDVNSTSPLRIRYFSSSVNQSENSGCNETTPHCESRIPCFGRKCPVLSGPMSVAVACTTFTSIKTQLSSFVNDGDNDGLYSSVENVTSNDVDDVYNDLMNNTPSHDILVLACENELFTAQMIENILIENSYGIKSVAVREALDNRDDNLSEEQMDDIYEAAEEISTYEDLIYQYDFIVQEYNYEMDQSLGALARRDTFPTDSIITYLDSIDDFWSDIKLINIAFGEGDNSTAQDIFDDIENKTDDEDELDDYSTLYEDVLDDIYENHSGDFSEMTSSQTDILEDIAFNGTYAAAIAKYLLIIYEDYEWESEICAPGESSARKANPSIIEENKELLIYPNPANNYINIIITDCDDCVGKFIIFDINGKEVYSENLNQNSNQISLSGLNPGIYITKVITRNEILIEKIILNK